MSDFRVAICCLGGIGDVIQLSMPARRLKKLYPKCKIGGFGRCDTYNILGSNPFFDEIGGREDWHSSPIPPDPKYLSLINKYDVVIDFRYGVKTFWRGNAPDFDVKAKEWRDRQDKTEFKLWVHDMPAYRMRLKQEYLYDICVNKAMFGQHFNWYSLGAFLSGIDYTPDDYYVHTEKVDGLPKEFIAISAPAHVDSNARPLLTKLWSNDKWNALMKKFPNFKFIALGSTKNGGLTGKNLDNTGSSLNLYQAAYVLSKAKFLVSIEGGLVHIARAVKKRSVVMFGPTADWFFGYPENVNIKADYPCEPCHNQDVHWGSMCYKDKERKTIYSPCLEAISVNQVKKAVEQILSIKHGGDL
jgi:ADP-heptose:LPS heptosyltransferase